MNYGENQKASQQYDFQLLAISEDMRTLRNTVRH